MSRTYKDLPMKLAFEKLVDEPRLEGVPHLSKAERLILDNYVFKRRSYKRRHGKLMRNLSGSWCGDRKCCRRLDTGGERTREKRVWLKDWSTNA